MKIRSKIRRENGHTCDLVQGDSLHSYAFNKENDYVCEVPVPEHIHRLIVEIPEGYEPAEPKEEPDAPADPAALTPAKPKHAPVKKAAVKKAAGTRKAKAE